MNCDWVRENIPLYLYNELGDDERHELEAHLSRCPGCASELEAMRVFHGAMNARPQLEVTPNLLASARIQLQEALEEAEQVRGWRRFTFDPFAWLRQVRFSPALASVLLLVGFGGGMGAMYEMAPALHGTAVSTGHDEASIASIRNIVPNADGKSVKIEFDRALPETVEGSVSDPKIHNLLLMASRSTSNPGVRNDSLQCLGQKPDDPQVREAMISSLRSDSNPGARLKAEEALGPYVRQDVRVRNAMLEALLNDVNPGVRAGALRHLRQVSADTSVRQALQQLAKEDPNQFIRQESQRVLDTVSELD